MFWLLTAAFVMAMFVVGRAQWGACNAHEIAETRVMATQRRAKLEAERERYADTLPAFSAETERCIEFHNVMKES